MLNRTDPKENARLTGNSVRSGGSRISRGQTMVEFTLSIGLLLVVMLVGVQFALLGQAALALSQGASAIARYAAVNEAAIGSPTYSGAPNAAMQNLLSPTILTGAGDDDLTVTINSYQGGTTNSPATTPVATQDRVVVTLSYDATSKILLPNPFMHIPILFPGISFPVALSASDSELYE